MKIILELMQIGSDKEWFLVVDRPGVQERNWIFRKKEVEELIKKLRSL